MIHKSFAPTYLKAILAAGLFIGAHAQKLLGSSFGVPGDDATFDYVIVGGGTAGLALATRLVEQSAGSVAIVEAGTFYEISNGNLSQVPATDGVFSGKSHDDWQPLIDWGYITTPQAGANDESFHYARGKTLGGGSARNFMVYQRGTEEAYQNWADAVDDQSYSFENFLPYFKKSVNFTGPDMSLRFANSTPEYDIGSIEDGTHQGPLSLTFPHYAQAFGTWATEGLKQIGIPIIDGFLSGKLIGQSYAMFTMDPDTMHRESSETSFLQDSLGNPAYTVYPLTMAKKIMFEGNTATGVTVETEGFEYVLSARKEVISAGGVIGSPQLLMVSGVGPQDILSSLNIPVVADRPGVGQGMQDHVFFGVSYRVNAPTASSFQDPAFAAEQAQLYNDDAAGMYTSPGADVLGWEKIPESLRTDWSNETQSDLAAYPADWPEVEYISISEFLGNQSNSRTGDPGDGFNYATLAVTLCTPRSRGTVTISSSDSSVHPDINPNFLTEQADIDVLIAGFKRAREFFETDALRDFTIGDEYYPGNDVTTDQQIEEYIRQNFNTIWHAACTCAMGKKDDVNAVVDAQGKVIGTQGLRVIDASAFPLLPPGHPQSTIYALAEKIACDISGNC